MITCVKLVANGMSISLNVDIGVPEGMDLNNYMTVREVVDYISVNPELDFTVEYLNESGEAILEEHFNENINKYLYNNKDNISVKHKTYMLPSGSNPADIIIKTDIYKGEYEHIDSNIVKLVVTDRHDVAGTNYFPIKYFVSPNYLLAFKNSGSDLSLDKVVYIYNELRYNNESWIKLVNKLAPGFDNVYIAFQYIINSDPNSFYKLIQKVKSKSTETLSYNGSTYLYEKKHWYQTKTITSDNIKTNVQEEIKDPKKVRELFEQLYNKSNIVHSIDKIEIKEIIHELVDGDILFDGKSKIYYYNNEERSGLFKEDGTEVSNESMITGIVNVRNQPLFEKLTTSFSLKSKMPTSSVNFIINDLFYELAHEDNTPIFEFGYTTKYYKDDGKIIINRDLRNGDDIKLSIGIPLILGRILNRLPDSFSLKLNPVIDQKTGQETYSLIGKEAIFDILFKAYNGEKDEKYALLLEHNSENQDFMDIIGEIENGRNKLNQIMQGSKEEVVSSKTIKDVNDKLIKKMIESGELQSYCIYG